MPKDLPVVHLERHIGTRIDRRTINATDYGRDPARWVRKGFKIISSSEGALSDSAIDFMQRQAEKEILRAANRGHPAYGDARRRWEHNQSWPDIRTRGVDDDRDHTARDRRRTPDDD